MKTLQNVRIFHRVKFVFPARLAATRCPLKHKCPGALTLQQEVSRETSSIFISYNIILSTDFNRRRDCTPPQQCSLLGNTHTESKIFRFWKERLKIVEKAKTISFTYHMEQLNCLCYTQFYKQGKILSWVFMAKCLLNSSDICQSVKSFPLFQFNICIDSVL